MKKLFVLIILGAVAFTANAQKIKESEVPNAVKTGFKKAYPAAAVEKWERENGNYEAEFDLNKIETSVLFSPNGELLETETEIGVNQLPKAVADYVAKNMAGKKIKEASKITDAKNVITYEAEIDETDYIFDANGAFIKKETEGKN